MSPEERADLLAGTAYTEPNVPRFGTTLQIASQTYEDITLRDLWQQLALLGRRVTLLEAQTELLWQLLKPDL